MIVLSRRWQQETHYVWRGSVILPFRADAATVSGLAKNMPACLLPILPGKLRLVVLIQTAGSFTRPKVSAGPPRQAAHDGGPILQPASVRILRSDLLPIFIWSIERSTLSVAGTTKVSTATELSFKIFSALVRQ